jgi:hypothetical protein
MENDRFANVIDVMCIVDGRRYTTREVAAICGVSPRTVKNWRQYGLKGRHGKVIVLESYCVGGYPRTLGAHLKEFLTQRDHTRRES